MADWDPELYSRFQRFRAEPVELILARLRLEPDDQIADFGCGDGEHTIELARRVGPAGHATGFDSSPAMLLKARERHAALEPALTRRVSFIDGDFASIEADGVYSVIFSNAALQWARDHGAVLDRWYRALKPGGRMVVQMPSNHEETAQVTLAALARDARWLEWVGDRATPSRGIGTPEDYRVILAAIGFVEIDCYYHTFAHPMASPAAIVEFTRATALRPFLERIPEALQAEFVADFTRRLEEAYGTSGPLTFYFRRLFLWARHP